MKMDMEQSRTQLLRQLDEYEEQGLFSKLQWSSANDNKICTECAGRNGKIYSIPDARKLIMSNFCTSKWCRCCFIVPIPTE